MKKLGLRSSSAVLSGEGSVAAVQGTKRKVEEPNHNRHPVEAPRQAKLSETHGWTRISAIQQALIDTMLLWFIICCALAWSLLDNGFFIDFVNALYVTVLPYI